MSEAEPDIEPRRVNVAEVPLTDIADVERARGLLHAVRLNPHRQKY
jgi:hypothetical protein